MKKQIIISIVALTLVSVGAPAWAGNVKVNLNFGLGGLYPPIIVREEIYRPPVAVRYYPEPSYPALDEVHFIYPDELGFYVAVGLPYELCYINNSYYLLQNGVWLRSGSRRGPWVSMYDHEVPFGLRRHQIARIREYRQYGYARREGLEERRDRIGNGRRNDQHHDHDNRRYSEERHIYKRYER